MEVHEKIRYTKCPAINDNKIKHMSKTKAGIKSALVHVVR